MYPFNKKFFDNWCWKQGINPAWVQQESTRIGTAVSEWAENRFYGIEVFDAIPRNKKEEAYLSGVNKFCEDWTITNSEQTVYNDEFGYAGTYDALAEKEGTEYLIDFKTYGAWRGVYDPKSRTSRDKIKKARLQVSMYLEALERDLPLAIIVFTPDGGYVEEFVDKSDKWKEWINENKDKLTEDL